MCDAGTGPVGDRRLVVSRGCWPLLANHIHPDNHSHSACIIWTVNFRNVFHLYRESQPAVSCSICTYIELKHSYSHIQKDDRLTFLFQAE